MKCRAFFKFVKALALSSSLSILTPHALCAQEDDAIKGDKAPPAREQEISPELMRSFLHLQEQVHATQLAIERGRHEVEAAAVRNSEALNKRLEILETSLGQANKENIAAIVDSNRQIQESNNRMMFMAGIFALIGFFALLLTGWLQWKTVSRLAGFAPGFPALLPQGFSPPGLAPTLNQPGSTQLRDAMLRLEHRIAEMEAGAHEATPAKAASASVVAAGTTVDPIHPAGGKLGLLIKEGEDLLAREELEKAVQHFDAVLAKHPGHPEVLLQKGTALERLRKDQEAIECYDQAIHADQNLTMAYLHKGGLFNRMERFSEAMECYEQALRVQESRQSA